MGRGVHMNQGPAGFEQVVHQTQHPRSVHPVEGLREDWVVRPKPARSRFSSPRKLDAS